jgi:hypothetical protein
MVTSGKISTGKVPVQVKGIPDSQFYDHQIIKLGQPIPIHLNSLTKTPEGPRTSDLRGN